MTAQSHSPETLVFEYDFEEPPEKVWRALTEPRLLEAWLAKDDLLPAEGGADATAAAEEAAAGAGEPASSDHDIVTAEPYRLLRYRWRDRESARGRIGEEQPSVREIHSVVTVELAPGPSGGTHLRLTHGEFRIVSAARCTAVSRITPVPGARRRRTPTAARAGQIPWRLAA